MNARQAILERLRRQIVPSAALPEVIDGSWVEYPDSAEQFIEMVRFSGAVCVPVRQLGEVAEYLKSLDEFRAAGRVFSRVEGVSGEAEITASTRPHDLADLDFVVDWGQMGVAENGAVWLTDERLPHRVCYFITQYLALVVRRETIVQNMHQAYQRLAGPLPGYGVFVAGPSKTADIEQSLVIGAHGCRQLHVFVL